MNGDTRLQGPVILRRVAAPLAIHDLPLERATLHGHFSVELPPVLTIEPGDTVRFSTLDAGWGLEAQHLDGSDRREFAPRDPEGRSRLVEARRDPIPELVGWRPWLRPV